MRIVVPIHHCIAISSVGPSPLCVRLLSRSHCRAQEARQKAPRLNPRAASFNQLGGVHLLRALEKHFPNTTGTLEGPFKLILAEFPREGLPAYRGSKRTVFPNSPVDVWRLEVEPCLAGHDLAFDGQRNTGWLASPTG
jgi:hypothetical protein